MTPNQDPDDDATLHIHVQAEVVDPRAGYHPGARLWTVKMLVALPMLVVSLAVFGLCVWSMASWLWSVA